MSQKRTIQKEKEEKRREEKKKMRGRKEEEEKKEEEEEERKKKRMYLRMYFNPVKMIRQTYKRHWLWCLVEHINDIGYRVL